jgi:RHH-type proline utilization regulon transcriptional repressor/proline dehydrogenase/delta 1-pyrroline-5-carboxylate dehydrogenase
MLFNAPPSPLDPPREAINQAFLADETAVVEALLGEPLWDAAAERRIQDRARDLVSAVRRHRRHQGSLDAFLHEYDLSSQEGVMLMCLAEALLRIPDKDTADRLIRDKLSKGMWDSHLGKSSSLLVNASTWGLMLTGRLVKPDPDTTPGDFLPRLAARLGEPVVRLALRQAMGILGQQFVMGRTIGEAITRSHDGEHRLYRHSFDMLGEAAVTAQDAERYTTAYLDAIDALATHAAADQGGVFDRPGISVKLSALHPRYEFAQRDRVMAELTPRLLTIVRHAQRAGIGLTLDAEEADRLDLSLDLFAAVFGDPSLGDWPGFGLAVQAYQKRALPVLDWLIDLARRRGRRIPVRLVKGAYWDTEIKRAQQAGLPGYPVYTRKATTDVSYLHCAKKLLAAGDAVYPQFATHNAHTLAAVLELAGDNRDFEFQRLHGMGEALYHHLLHDAALRRPCRVYAPVGGHQELLPYLVRRLLENGANTSFVNRVEDERTPIEQVTADPVARLRAASSKPHPRIPLPVDIYSDRRNSAGINFADPVALAALDAAMSTAVTSPLWQAAPIVGGKRIHGEERVIIDPADRRRSIGKVVHADAEAVSRAVALAAEAAPSWERRPVHERAAILERAADLFEQHGPALITLCVREGGKTVADALAEVREAADYCRYYAALARRDFAPAHPLPGPTGEHNELQYHGRGVFACISPWNFPLAIFTGQVTAALMAGNAVLAKPAGQTPLIAQRAVQLLHEAGVPHEALHYLPGEGRVIGPLLTGDARIAGIAFTGSTDTARGLYRALAAREGAIVPLIAETGGLNAMIVDSSALPEQVVKDVLRSAFNSAGQRCSALRVLFVQDDVADKTLDLLAGAMAELSIGDPGLVATDVGPVIDETARDKLAAHAVRMEKEGRLIYQCGLPPETAHGSFFAPRAFEIARLDQLQQEVFGPILHVIRYPAVQIDGVIEAINRSGYGLTLGIHSRIDATIQYIQRRARVGNCYVNRDMIGAVVGVQPFGGEGLSGTGPKAGGPDYLRRFAVERTLTVNTAAVGGNTALLSLEGE